MKTKRLPKRQAGNRIDNAVKFPNVGDSFTGIFSHVTVSKERKLPILHFRDKPQVIICGTVLTGLFRTNKKLLKPGVKLTVTYAGQGPKKIKGNYPNLFNAQINGKELVNPDFDFNQPVPVNEAFADVPAKGKKK